MNKILIIEDDRFIAQIYRDKFQTEGFEVDVAENGQSGTEKIVNNTPHVVMLDLMLPGMNGVDVLKFIRSRPATRTLPVVVLSNAYIGGTMQAAWKAGANKCLTKANCTPNHLVEEVRKVLQTRNAPPQACSILPIQSETTFHTIGSFGLTESQTSSLEPKQNRLPGLLKELRHLLQNLIQSDEASLPARVLELYRGVRALAGSASLAGLPPVARLASALEALVNELQARPRKLNASTLRTVAQAVDLLAVLVQEGDTSHDDFLLSPLILVLDDDDISRETVCTALEKAHLHALSLNDTSMALKLMKDNRFDLVFLDVDMPGLSGFEVCKRLHATPLNAGTPVVFVTMLTNFETRASSTLSGGTDLIAKPIVLIELAVKALIHLLTRQIPPPLQAKATAKPPLNSVLNNHEQVDHRL